jgi:hypothetical protein
MFKRDDVMTTRPASTSLLTIDSGDRYDNYTDELFSLATETEINITPYNFVIRKPESMMNGFLTRLAVTEIAFPYATPNINAKTSQMIVSWSLDGTTVAGSAVIDLDTGFYIPADLAAAVQAAVRTLDASLSGFVMTYGGTATNPNVPRFFYNVPAATGKATQIWFTPVPYNTASYPYPDTVKQLFNLLGFNFINALPVGNPGASNTGISEYTLCQFTRYLDIVCPQLTYNQPLKDTSSQKIVRDSLCRVYLDQVSGGFQANTKKASDGAFTPTGCVPFTIYHNFTLPKEISWTPNQPVPGSLQFQVFDDSGELLSAATDQFAVAEDNIPFNSGYLDWSMTLLVTEN